MGTGHCGEEGTKDWLVQVANGDVASIIDTCK